jgi:hypothetical protein
MSDALASVLGEALRNRADRGIAEIFTARAMDAIRPGSVRLGGNGSLYVGNQALSVRSLYAESGLPGVRFALPIADVFANGQLPSTVPNGLLDGTTDARSFSASIGSNNADIFSQLHALWDKIAPTKFYTADQLAKAHKILSAGILAYPTTAADLEANAPSLDASQYAPATVVDATRAAWEKMTQAFKAMMASYYKRNLADVLAQGRILGAWSDLWDGIYAGTKFLSELPANIVGFTLSAVWKTFFRGPIVILVLIVAGGAALWFFWPTLFAAAKVARAQQAKS